MKKSGEKGNLLLLKLRLRAELDKSLQFLVKRLALILMTSERP